MRWENAVKKQKKHRNTGAFLRVIVRGMEGAEGRYVERWFLEKRQEKDGE